MRVFVTGATGFVGRHLIPRLLEADYQVRCLVRDPSKINLRASDRLELAIGDITEAHSLAGKLDQVDIVVHLVGIIREFGGATFERVVVGGTQNVLNAAQAAGVRLFCFQSALGTRPHAHSRYHQTKWMAEEMIRESGIPYSILRPSIIYGTSDGFTPILVELVHGGPFIPIPGDGKAKLQPIYIEDQISCISWCLNHAEAVGKTTEIGGAIKFTFEELVDKTAEAGQIHRPKLHIPVSIMMSMAGYLGRFRFFPISRDQLIMLQEDNICDPNVLPRVFGIQPASFEETYPPLVRQIIASRTHKPG